ncbi:MAG: hypothetical protein QME78_15555 [Thermodesulfobacteriota bacterium]|nr:hypothetical protein [Thermodesulfobacteriota bacterium]
MEVIAILGNYDLKQRKEIAKYLAGITKE